MKRMALALVFVLALSLPAHAGVWRTGAVTNPATDAILVATAPLSSHEAAFVILLRTTVTVVVAIERLNAGGQAVVNDSVTFTLTTGPALVLPMRVTFNEGDVFRVRIVGGVTGTVQGALRFNDGYCLQGLGCDR